MISRRARSLLGTVAIGVSVAVAGCSDDDGAQVREAGSVSIVGEPPPEGGGSVSAVGSGCTTKGATTKVAARRLEISVAEHTITAPGTGTAGVTEVVVKNVGTLPHELMIVRAPSVDALPTVGDRVDEAKLDPAAWWRIAAFPRNTICRGTFELAAGTYVLLDNLAGTTAGDPSNLRRGMAVSITLS